MFKIFYSWQSDLNHNKTRDFIRECIDKAIDLAQETEMIEAYRDEATKDVTGSPDIVQTIFSKIDSCDLFVADVSLCYENAEKRKKSPNPNVLIELGYAVHTLGWERIICVLNDSFGKIEELPFDIQHNRIKNFSLEMNKRAEVKAEIGEIIFKTIRDLRNIGPRIDKNTSQFIVGTYDEKSNKVVKCLMPINLEERNSTTRIDEYKEKAFQLATRIEDLSERIAADKEFEEQTLQMEKSEEENAFLKALNITGYNDLHKNLQKLQNFGSVDSFYDKYTKPVEAFETDSVKEWLNRYVSFNPSSSFFDFGTLTETKIDLGFKKEQSLNGSDNEREKYRKYKELYRTLYQIWIRTEFINSFTGLLFFPVAIQNISKMNDNDIRVVIELKRGAAIHPSKEIITDSLRDQRGWICHFGLVDDLFYLPRNPMAEIEYSPSQDRNPHYHVTLNGYEEDKEDEDDYEKNLQQYILEPVDTTHFSTSVSKLRPSETVWLSGGMLIKPDEEGCVKIEYSIHSTYSSGEISGVLEYTVKA